MRQGRICLLALVSIAAPAADIQVVEQIIAKVNGDIITRSDIERTRESLIAELRERRVPATQVTQLLKDRENTALRDEIDRLLLVQKGKELSINVDPEITRQLAEIQLNAKISDTDKFHQYIRENSGMTFEDFKAQMKNQRLTQRVIQQEVGSRINIPKTELQKYYEEHKAEFIRKEQVFLREIFLSIEGKKPAEIAAIEKKANTLVARARKGEKFTELARDNSDSESAKNFGEIGWFKKGELRADVEKLVFAEKRGFVSDPIKTDRGFLIIRLEERHETGQAAFAEVENEVMERLYTPRMEPRVREYLTKLREDAFLEIREGYIDAGAAPNKDTAWKDPAQLKPETVTKAEVAASRKKKLLWVLPSPWGSSHKPAAAGSQTPAAAAPVPPAPAKN
ncbi:MAG: peptidylprolyl isomerase [Bryobacteraceae bacterium]